MSTRRDRVVARAILRTRAVDTAARRFDRLRSRAVVRWASVEVLAEFNAIAYGGDDVYRPGTASFRSRLFPWESAAVREHFPAPPAQVILGGAGGGREAFALAALGYDVVAFEPAAGLADSMARTAAARGLTAAAGGTGASAGAAAETGTSPAAAVPTPAGTVRAFRAGYDDLPSLFPTEGADGPATALHELGPFTAAILGWGSFSHLGTAAARVRALELMAARTDGPILVSFLAFAHDEASATGAPNGRQGEHFSIYIGYYHTVGAEELNRLASAAGLRVVALNTDETESSWPHAILRR